MVLTLYVARFLGLQAAAAYGFVVGGSAALTALTGLGLDQPIHRYLVRAQPGDAARRLRDRLLLRAIMSAVLIGAGALTLAEADPRSLLMHWAVAMILLLEPIIYDLHEGLVSRRRPVAANALLFARAGGWVLPVVTLGVLDKAYRSLDLVFAGWAAGLVAGVAVAVAAAMRRPDLRAAAGTTIDWMWMRAAPAAMPLAYLADLGQVGMIYSDRYLVSALAGVTAAGAFVFLWGFTNAVVPLVQAAVFNHLTPALVSSHGQEGASWQEILHAGQRQTLRLSLLLGGALFVTLVALLPVVHIGHGTEILGLAALMIAASVVRLQADVLQMALASTGDDAGWVRVNLIGLIAAPLIGIASIALFGLVGAGLQMLLTAWLALLLRWRILNAIGR
ncbi:hypothetical protein [Sphingomonas aracearum]|uniref:Polysaccharide biosynthesis protein n=1 Tax=Sphingomonas aracearum TaxID=2283317 RepID=A0A369VSE5_9SPHN|nr:hypothetical protein [Sphingomonas aracearum]RDE05316.1 hypothetical protein DVW87_08595 [Sphingomonas aracearum]